MAMNVRYPGPWVPRLGRETQHGTGTDRRWDQHRQGAL